MNAITVVEDGVRELVRRRGLDPVADPAAVRRLVDEVIAEHDDRQADRQPGGVSLQSDDVLLEVQHRADAGQVQPVVEQLAGPAQPL